MPEPQDPSRLAGRAVFELAGQLRLIGVVAGDRTRADQFDRRRGRARRGTS